MSELDEENWEVRRVGLFDDGRLTWADESGGSEGECLADQTFPDFAEIAEFLPKVRTKEQFETLWALAKSGQGVNPSHEWLENP